MWTKFRNWMIVILSLIVFGEVYWGYQLIDETLAYQKVCKEDKNRIIQSKDRMIIALQDEVKYLKSENSKLIEKINKSIRLEDLSRFSRSISQGVNRKQLRSIITNVLNYLGETDSKWVDLLMFTAQVESDLGRLYKQVRGPAVGIFQMEPATERDLWKYYLSRNKDLAEKIKNLRVKAHLKSHEMEYNLGYSISMTYVHYKSRKTNPSKMDLEGMVKEHKIKYNTIKGKATFISSVDKIYGSYILD